MKFNNKIRVLGVFCAILFMTMGWVARHFGEEYKWVYMPIMYFLFFVALMIYVYLALDFVSEKKHKKSTQPWE